MRKKVWIKKSRRKTHKVSKHIFLLTIGVFVIVFFWVFSFNRKVGNSAALVKAHETVQSVLPTSTPSQRPTTAPTQMPTPLPTQVVNYGFCLYAPVILYHHIEPLAEARKRGHAQLTVDSTYFELQMKYLVEHGYKSIKAEELVDSLLNHTFLPAKPIVVTLDDGYDDIYTYAFPIAKKYNIILNLAIPAGLIGNSGYMSWGQLKEMVNSGFATAYNHTWSHFSLPNGTVDKIQQEIETAKSELEKNLGRPAGKVFFYPYGTFDGKTIEILKKNGYVAAFSTIPSHIQCDGTMFVLRRNHIGNAPLSMYGL